MRCDICNTETKIIKAEKYQYIHSGLNNVFLKNIKVEICKTCNLESPFIPKIIRLHETIAKAIVLKPTLLIGEEVRFLRKNLRIKAQIWSTYLRKDVATISRSEKIGQIQNKDFDILIRLLYVRLWEEKNEQFFSEKIVESMSKLENQEVEILIDVNNIDSFLYSEKEEVWADEIYSPKFDYSSDFRNKATIKEEVGNYKPASSYFYNYNKDYAENSELAPAS